MHTKTGTTRGVRHCLKYNVFFFIVTTFPQCGTRKKNKTIEQKLAFATGAPDNSKSDNAVWVLAQTGCHGEAACLAVGAILNVCCVFITSTGLQSTPNPLKILIPTSPNLMFPWR